MSEGKLPEGWVQAVLGDYLYLKNGFAFKSTEYVTPGAHSYPVIRISDLDGTCATDSSAVHVLQGAEGFTIEKGDLLIAMSGATTGKIGIYAGNIPAYQNQRVGNIKLRSSKYGDEKYRNYLITSASKTILDEAYGGAQPNISGKSIEALSFHLAPLAEQKIIAEKLDTLLAQVVSTKARLEQIPQILKRFRQAVLSAAVSGLLIDSNKRKHHPLCSEWQWADLPSTWDVHKYSELVDSRLGKMLDKAKNVGSATKYLGNINVRWFGFNLENLQDILISDIERRELSLEPGDVLICEGGEPGRCAIWSEPQDTPVIFQKALHRARVKEKIIPEWLAYNLKNDSNNISLSQLFTGTTIKHLTGKALANYPIRVTPLDEQHEIVRRVEQLFAYADTIEKQVNSALTRVNSLTQSILAKAFRGELTAQWRAENPDLISGENSAAALLEKIKAERTASGSKKTT